MLITTIFRYAIFQFTTSRGGRLCPIFNIFIKYSFNSRPHEEVDVITVMDRYYADIFQFTTSRGGRLVPPSVPGAVLIFQFTTSRGGRQPYTYYVMNPYNLSIHDLTRRSTSMSYLIRCHLGLSIHDLTRRSTNTIFKKISYFGLSIHDLTRRSTTSVMHCWHNT